MIADQLLQNEISVHFGANVECIGLASVDVTGS